MGIRETALRRAVSVVTIICMFVTMFMGLSQIQNNKTYAMSKIIKVTASTLYARSNAGTSYSKVGKLKKNNYRVVKGSKKDTKGTIWYKVSVGSKNGYISSKYTKELSFSVSSVSNTKGTVNVSNGNVIVRSGPAALFSSVGKLAKGKTITINGKAKDMYGNYWYRFKYNGSNNYTIAKYIKTTSTKTTTAKATSTTSKKDMSNNAVATTTTSSTSSSFTVTSLSNLTGKVATSSSPLNVRSGPATTYKVVGSLKKGKTFSITGKTTVGNMLWYRFKYNSSTTAYANATYVTTSVDSAIESKSATTDTTNSRTLKARQAAVDWAIKIANDNSFHYGRSSWAHHNGCYYCGTNQTAGNAKFKDGASASEALKTYCCNPFVTAAYNHGAGAKEVDCKTSSMRVGLANDTNKVFKTKSWMLVTKPSKITSLKVGDILLTPTHAMLYAGNGKVVHAAHHDNGSSNKDYWNDSIKVNVCTDYQWNRTTKIYRYLGVGKY